MRHRLVFAALSAVAVLGLLGSVSATELVVQPGWSDGFFDGSDHQTSGIDVYIPEPDWGSIPMPGDPVPVPMEEWSEKTTPDLSDLNVTPSPVPTETEAAAVSRLLAIRYLDSSVQLVPLTHPFRNVARMRAVALTGPSAGIPGFTGRWNSAEFGRITFKAANGALTASAARRGLRIEGSIVGSNVFEGTWCDSSRRSGRIVITLAADGRTFTAQRFAGVVGAASGFTARR